jgi:hypothetical protein
MPPLSTADVARSSSDVAVARSLSTSPDVVRKSSDNLSAQEGVPDTSEKRGGYKPSEHEGSYSPSSPLTSSEEENENLWKKVRTCRFRSLDSLKNSRIKVKFSTKSVKGTHRDHNDPVIEAAKKNLTPEQHECVRKHHDAVRTC